MMIEKAELQTCNWIKMTEKTNNRNIQIVLALVFVAVTGYRLLTIAGFWQAVFIYVNLGALYCYGLDKYRAIHNSSKRIPEMALLGIAAIGGVPGSVLGQLIFRHKIRKRPFQFIFFSIMIFQAVLLTIFLFMREG